MKKKIIKENVDHQGIGGKEIIIEREITVKDILNTNFDKMTIAMANFALRRSDLLFEAGKENMKVYYGHVGILGYFVADDEIKDSD